MKKSNLFIPATLAFLAPTLACQADTILWTTGTSADTSGSWAGPTTFNGQSYTAADTLEINGTATKTVTTSGTITAPLSLAVSSTGATTLTGTSVDGTLTKTNAGALTLATANAFGDVTISGGKFVLTNSAGLGTTGTLNVNSGTPSGITGSYTAPGATFFYDAATINSSYSLSKNLSFGTVAANTTYGLAMQSGSAATPLATTLSGNLTGASNVTLWLDVRVTATPNYSTWIFSGDNSAFSGNIRLNRGNVQFNSAASLGTGTIFVQTNGSDGSGTTPSNLAFAFAGTVANPITLRAGSGTVTSIDTGANNVTLSNTITLSGDATAGAGATFNKVGSGTLAFTGTLETLERVNGTPTATSPLVQGALDAGNVSFNLRAGTLDASAMTGSTLTINSLAGVTGTTLALGAKTLDINGGTSTTFSGTLSGTGGIVTKSGTNSQVLAGTNTYSGGTVITGKNLGAGSNDAFGTGAVTVNASAAFGAAYASGGTPFLRTSVTGLNVPNDIALPATAGYYGLQSGAAAGSTIEWSGDISGGGAGVVLQIDTPNPGDALTATTLSGNSTFAGQIRLNRGRLNLASSTALGTAGLFLQTNTNSIGGNLTFTGPTSFANNLIIGTTTAQWINTGENDITWSGSVSSATSGSGGFSKMGSGTLFLTGSVASYLPNTTGVASGILDLSGIDEATFDAGILTGSGTIELPGKTLTTPSGTFGGTLAGTGGSLSKTGTGTLTLTGSNTYTGATTIQAGTLVISGALDATAVEVKADATLAGNGTTEGSITVRTGGHQSFALAADPLSQSPPRENAGALVMESGTIVDLTAAVVPASGTYILATAAGGITGTPLTVNLPAGVTGILSVTGGNTLQFVIGGDPYGTWAGTFGLSGPNAEFDFDADDDGIDNGLEWILGGNPTSSDTTILPDVTGDATTGLTLVFTRNPDSIGVATLAVEWDVDLDAFAHSVTIGTSNVPASGNNPTVTLGTPSANQVTVNIPGANATTGKLFARLKATKN